MFESIYGIQFLRITFTEILSLKKCYLRHVKNISLVTFDIDIFTFKKNELLICETNTLKKSDQKQITITTTKQLIPLD